MLENLIKCWKLLHEIHFFFICHFSGFGNIGLFLKKYMYTCTCVTTPLWKARKPGSKNIWQINLGWIYFQIWKLNWIHEINMLSVSIIVAYGLFTTSVSEVKCCSQFWFIGPMLKFTGTKLMLGCAGIPLNVCAWLAMVVFWGLLMLERLA